MKYVLAGGTGWDGRLSARGRARSTAEAGFAFEFPDWPAAARDLIRRVREDRAGAGNNARADSVSD
jgi:hypothetical protein